MITPLPSLDRTSATFKTELDAFFLTALPNFSVQAEAARVAINAADLATAEDAVNSAISAAAARASELAAASYAGAGRWVIGTTYVADTVVWSPISNRLYRRIATGGGTTDPSANASNWSPVSIQSVANGGTGATTAAQARIELGGLVTLAGAETLTNKTMNGANNTFSNIPGAAISSAVSNALSANTAAACTGNASTASSAQGPSFVTAIAGAGGEANLTCRISGQSDAYLFNNATGWGLFSNAGGQALEFNRAAGKFSFYGNANTASKASTLASGGVGGTAMTFNWNGVGGQPAYVWGGNDGITMQVYNPSNFNVNYAATSGSAGTAGYATSAGGTIGVSQSWKDVTGSRAASTAYYNTTGRPIMVSVICTGPDGGPALYIDSIRIASTGNPGGTIGNDHNTVCGIVPNGSSYYINMLAQSVAQWLELR